MQNIYSGITSDSIVLSFHGSASMNRQALCSILVDHHNNGKNPGQTQTNRQYLGYLQITQAACVDALTYTLKATTLVLVGRIGLDIIRGSGMARHKLSVMEPFGKHPSTSMIQDRPMPCSQ